MLLEDFYNCKHEWRLPVFRVFTNETKHYGYQCDTCGKWLPKKASEFETPPTDEFDYQKRNSVHERCSGNSLKILQKQQQEFLENRRTESDEWWSKYNEYLNSDTWRRRRLKILERDSHVCQGCLSRPALHVHHLTYDHVFEELAFELISLCQHCHDKAHGKELDVVDLSRML